MLRIKLIDMEFRKEKFDKTIIKIVGEYISTEDFFENQSSMISVIDADISKDFSYCKVKISVFGDNNSKDKIIKELNQKAYILQNVISKSIRTSRIPKLRFVIDNSFELQQKIDNLINKITKDV
ncbi:MAG: ribosome-binding factor A [Chloroflexi bacterium]|nr:ribosome-binding factor A [Chloroflexota bacterium]|tara:strand:+ start:3895 stop:4266 length:372 start_codon:yes stop_codon:yes gene_type:complete